MQHRQDNLLANRNLLPGMVSGQCAFRLRTFSPVARYFSLLPCLCILSFSSPSSPATMLSPGDRSAIQQQQQQLLDENQRQRDALERSAPLTITPSPETSAGTEGPCFTVSRIVVSGATRLTSAETDRLVAPWVNQCLNITGLTAVTDAVTDGYIRRGYITSRAFLTEQDLSGGILHITVMEGRLQQIRAEGADLPARTLKMVFPGMEGKVLNLRDIEQGMEQINRLRTEPVQIEISPGDREGWSVVTLTASPEWPVTGSVGIDNSGQKNTGTGQLNGVLSFNNPLGLADNWFVSGGRSSDFSVSHDARNFAAGVSLPYGYTLVDYTYSWSDYLSTIDNRGWRWRSTGDLQTHRLGLSHVLFRNGDMKTALTGGLQHRIIHNYLDDVLLQGSSRKLTSFSVGLNHTHKFLGGVGTLNPVFTRGMPWFGAESDHGKRGDLPVNQFRKWSVSASFQRPVTDRVWWLTSAYAQWSPDRLHGVEQLSLGVRVQCVALRSSISPVITAVICEMSCPGLCSPCHMWELSVQWLHWTAAGCTLTEMTRTRPARCGVVLPGSAPPVTMFPVRSLPGCLWFTRTGLPLTISRFTGALLSRFKGLLP
ncbi:putative hemolysin activator ShlB-type [Escherichia coli]|nr:putative hemolysin activator ShlB-type [Escherichia coli]